MVRPSWNQGICHLPYHGERPSPNRRASQVPELARPPSAVVSALATIRGLPGHAFWPDSISLVESSLVDPDFLSSHGRVTDSYLLALAKENNGKLATMDHKLAAEAVTDGKATLTLI